MVCSITIGIVLVVFYLKFANLINISRLSLNLLVALNKMCKVVTDYALIAKKQKQKQKQKQTNKTKQNRKKQNKTKKKKGKKKTNKQTN